MNFIFVLIVILDQITKYIAVSTLKGNESIHLIGSFLNLTYVENTGAAFGILQNQRWFFILITNAIIVSIFIYAKKSVKKSSKLTLLSLNLIVGGAIGNLIDRILHSYVIDFIDVKFGQFYDFPVFNVADIAVVIGTFLLSYVVLTGKEEI